VLLADSRAAHVSSGKKKYVDYSELRGSVSVKITKLLEVCYY
jgi:hypothetical protein